MMDRRGTLLDKKWALEVSGVTPTNASQELLNDGFGGGQVMGDAAFHQVSLLGELPSDMLLLRAASPHPGIQDVGLELAQPDHRRERERVAVGPAQNLITE